MYLLDTDVVADVMRGVPSAIEWMRGGRHDGAALPGPVVLELLDGCQNKLDAKRVYAFTDAFRIYWPKLADNERAHVAFGNAKLAHGIGIIDMLIAQTAIGRDATLMTFNERHFRGIPGLTFAAPYAR